MKKEKISYRLSHSFFMHKALQVSQQNVNKTGNNPCVGCVVVYDSVIQSAKCTGIGGVPHAEYLALSCVDKTLCDVYLTLEPCCHYGKTKPCINLLREANVKRVFIYSIDKNPLMNGKSIFLLRSYGISVFLFSKI